MSNSFGFGGTNSSLVLKKYQELNKFIAENVNLGTIGESQKALS